MITKYLYSIPSSGTVIAQLNLTKLLTMKTLKWILLGALFTGTVVSCNLTDNESGSKPFQQLEPDGEIKLKDESDSRLAKWDTEHNEGITQAEFEAVFEDESFESWDLNGDKILDFKEFKKGVFELHSKD